MATHNKVEGPEKSSFRLYTESWTLDHYQTEKIRNQDPGDSLGQILKEYWQLILKRRKQDEEKPSRSSLKTAMASRIYHSILASDDVDTELCNVLNSAEPEVICRLLFNGGALPYLAYRCYKRLLIQGCVPDIEAALHPSRTIDEAIIENENYLRAHNDPDSDSLHLVTIQGLSSILNGGQSARISDEDVTFDRSNPSRAELPLLDELRPSRVSFRGSDSSFKHAFDWATKTALRDLDWKNVLAVGATVLSTLVGPSCSSSMRIDHPEGPPRTNKHFDCLELNLYDLDADEANVKLEHIFNIWLMNKPPNSAAPVVSRGPYTIIFGADQTYISIYIPLTVFKSRTEALIANEIDPFALLFDGNQVSMLPRCARAIETGYTVATTRNLFCHPSSQAGSTAEWRIVSCAGRGFGLRILPIYSQTLRDDTLDAVTEEGSKTAEDETMTAYRKPTGQEAGYKTLRRIAYIGQDRVNRTWRVTPLSNYLEHIASSPQERVSFGYFSSRQTDSFDLTSRKCHTSKDLYQTAPKQFREQLEASGRFSSWISIWSFYVDSGPSRQPPSAPLEAFTTLCENWRLWAESGLVPSLNRNDGWEQECDFGWLTVSEVYPFVNFYLEDRISCADELGAFYAIRCYVDSKLQVASSRQDFRGYLTGRTRMQRVGCNIEAVTSQDLKWPLAITKELEDLVADSLPADTLVPMYDSRAHQPNSPYEGSLAPLVDTTDSQDAGNLRYLKINNTLMWKGLDHNQDKALELLMLMSMAFRKTGSSSYELFSKYYREFMIAYLLSIREAMLPQVPDVAKWKSSVLPLREAILFRAWAMARLTPPQKEEPVHLDTNTDIPYSFSQFLYPFPDDLFWGPEFENDHKSDQNADETSDGERQPPWWYRKEAYTGLDRDAEQERPFLG